MISVDKEILLRLRVKYEALLELRLERDQHEVAGLLSLEGEEHAHRQRRMKRVAREFPGALRELETRDVAGMRARLADLERGLRGEEVELASGLPGWVEVSAAFHSVLRCVLGVKARVGREKGFCPERWSEVRGALRGEGGVLNEMDLKWLERVDVSMINRYLDPPGRRLLNVVWEELSARFGLSVEQVKSRVFQGD